MIGRTLLTNNIVMPTRVSADGVPVYKPGGITIDWSTVAAPGSDVNLPDGSIIRSGNKYLRYGQVMSKIALYTVQTLTGTATGGTFTLTAQRPDVNVPVTTAALAFNATAAAVLAALQAVLGPGQAASSSGGPLGTGAVTLNFGTFFPILVVNGALLTGGTVTPAVTTVGASGGMYGPYDPAAGDGRANFARGDVFIMDETVLQYSSGPTLGPGNDQVGSAIEGGLVFIDRVLHSGAAAASLALGPTLVNLGTAFPRLSFARD